MSYQEVCIFNPERKCPLHQKALIVDGSLCSACVDVMTIEKAFKAQVISQLLVIFHDEKKAKEAFNEIMKCVNEW